MHLSGLKLLLKCGKLAIDNATLNANGEQLNLIKDGKTVAVFKRAESQPN